MSNFNILKSMMYLDVWGTDLIITIDIKASYPFRGAPEQDEYFFGHSHSWRKKIQL
jgi:hypothetical protein